MVPAEEAGPTPRLTPEQRLLVLDVWVRSKLPAKDFAPLVGISTAALYAWKRAFEKDGPAGLLGRKPGAPRGSRLSEVTKRAILMTKQSNPEWGCDRIHDMLMRAEGLHASPGAIQRFLEEEGYVVEDVPTRPHPDKKRRFERARPNELWQTDMFTFMLKRQNRRVHVVVYMDDNSRFVVGFGLHATASGALVREVFEGAIANFGAPKEVLTDQGPQYYTWRGKSAFRKLLDKRGIRHVVARARHPETLGKVERFWGTLWRECVETAIFRDLEDARQRIGLFVDHYNFYRTHQGIGGLVPADRFFEAAPEVHKTLKELVVVNGDELARDGVPRKSMYLTGRVGDKLVTLHGEGDNVVMTDQDGAREVVDLQATGRRAEPGQDSVLPEPVAKDIVLDQLPGAEDDAEQWPPGTSPLDEGLRRLEALDDQRGEDA